MTGCGCHSAPRALRRAQCERHLVLAHGNALRQAQCERRCVLARGSALRRAQCKRRSVPATGNALRQAQCERRSGRACGTDSPRFEALLRLRGRVWEGAVGAREAVRGIPGYGCHSARRALRRAQCERCSVLAPGKALRQAQCERCGVLARGNALRQGQCERRLGGSGEATLRHAARVRLTIHHRLAIEFAHRRHRRPPQPPATPSAVIAASSQRSWAPRRVS
jgi:hypothetical protein